MIGWLLDTKVIEEIGRAAGSERVKAWGAGAAGGCCLPQHPHLRGI